MGVISPLHVAAVKKHPPSISIERSRRLRRDATDAERAMWRALRQSFPEGRWRRQVPLRHYIGDFASHCLKVVIEIDGGQHSAERDEGRSSAIEAEGYRIIRFWNSEVLENLEGCMRRLGELLGQDHPHPTAARQQVAKPSYPSPIKGEESLL
jgi:very-short-patch-repair endonuclease